MTVTREQRRQLERENAKRPAVLREVPRDMWPINGPVDASRSRVWLSRSFLVQEFVASNGAAFRLSVSRTTHNGDRWAENITWDELMQIKRECGYANADAVEIYPSDADVVNVANMRHLWIVEGFIPFKWRKG